MFCSIVAAAAWIVAVHGFDFETVSPSDLRWEPKQALQYRLVSIIANATHGFALSEMTPVSSPVLDF